VGRYRITVYEHHRGGRGGDRPQPTDLPTLDARIDGDALDTLLYRGSPSVTISFEYAGTVVLARGDGTVRVTVTDCASASSDD